MDVPVQYYNEMPHETMELAQDVTKNVKYYPKECHVLNSTSPYSALGTRTT